MNSSNDRIEELKQRTKRCRCKYCGSKLEIRRIIYGKIEEARVEIFCSECDRIEYGVEPELYQAAKYFVEEMDFNVYPDLDETEKTKQMSVAKVSEIMAWCCKNLGFIDKSGFKVPLDMDETVLGEMLVLDETELSKMIAQDGTNS